MALLYHGKAYSIVTDQLGTPTEAYNDEGEEVWSRKLDMNGNILEEKYNQYAPYSEQIWIPFLFQGQYYNFETELAYNRFRYYSPELGRYISEDPIRFSSGEINFQAYISDSNILCDVFGLQGTASYKKPGLNGNAKKSENDQHGYEIYNRFGQVVKTGVSGGRVRKNDQKSARAEKQVRAWNRDVNDPNGPYTSKIVKRVKGGKNARKKS